MFGSRAQQVVYNIMEIVLAAYWDEWHARHLLTIRNTISRDAILHMRDPVKTSQRFNHAMVSLTITCCRIGSCVRLKGRSFENFELTSKEQRRI